MWRLRMMASRFVGLVTKRNLDRELNSEIAEHLHFLTERFVRQGMTQEEAVYAARRQFGGIAQLQQDYRDTGGMPPIENFVRDLIFSLRLLRKRPGFSLVAIAVLALGLGANSAIFSLVNGMLLRPCRIHTQRNSSPFSSAMSWGTVTHMMR